MPQQTVNGIVGAPTGYWFNRDVNSAAIVTVNGTTEIVYTLTDGSFMRLQGSGFTFTGTNGTTGVVLTGGTITGLTRTDASGATIYETVTAVSYAATTFQSHLAETDLQGIASEIFAGADTFNGSAFSDFFRAFGGNDTINGGGGNDTVSYQAPTMIGPITVTLGTGAGVPSNSGGLVTAGVGSTGIGTDTLSSVESIIGTSAADTFTANANFLGSDGSNFNDFEGRGGDDVINGNGNSRLSFANSFATGLPNGTTGATVTFTNSVANANGSGTSTGSGLGTDTFSGVYQLRGSQYNDTITATGASQAAFGNDANAFFFDGRGGNDTLDGGGVADGPAGNASLRYDANRARYDNDSGSITATLGTSNTVGAATTSGGTVVAGVGGSAGNDTLNFVEQIRGTNSADTFTAFANFRGLFGAFNEFEGAAGNDTITGNSETRVGYTQATAGVTVTWAATATNAFTGAGTATGNASVGTDIFVSGVNSVRGSSFADTFTATGAHGTFSFGGRGGNDTINGGTFNINNLDFDTATFTGSTAGITVSLGATNTVTGDASVGTDTLFQVERIRGSHFNDIYTVTAGFAASYGALNVFDGGGGDDLITGNGSTRVDYNSALAGVTVNLGTGQAYSTAASDLAAIGIDTFTGVNGVEGSRFADVLIGSNGAQAELFRGEIGNDTIDGGGGLRDVVDYRSSTEGVIVNLATNSAASDGLRNAANVLGTDSLTNIEDVAGSEFGDSITGDANNNYLFGQGGDDSLVGGAGDDILVGDDTNLGLYGGVFGVGTEFDVGNDTLVGGIGNDQLYGGAGNDQLDGGNDNDILYGGGGLDALTGGTGDDQLDGGFGADALNGGDGNDSYFVDDAGDTTNETNASVATGGFDTVYSSVSHTLGTNIEQLLLTGSAAGLTATGNNDANALYGSLHIGGVTLLGLGGNDVFYGSNYADSIDGGEGNDVLVAFYSVDGVDTLVGGAGDDVYYTFEQGDVIIENANGGLDTVYAQENTVLSNNIEQLIVYAAATSATGNGGDNNIFGNNSSNSLTLDGGSGNDWLIGSDQFDTLQGGSGNDILQALGGTNRLVGGIGDDQYFSTSSTDTIVETAGEGFDTLYVNYNVAALADNVDQLLIFGGATSGVGNGLNNVLYGNNNSVGTLLDGAAGTDVIYGSNFADTIVGGLGSDILFGLGGADRFRYAAGNMGADTILDFARGTDQIDLAGLGYTQASIGGAIQISGGANALISFNSGSLAGTSVTLLGVTQVSVAASDFLFA